MDGGTGMNRSGRRPASAAEREAAQRLVDSVMAESSRRGRDSLLPFPVMIAIVTLVLLAVVLFLPALLWDDLLRGNGEGNVVDRLTRVLAFAIPAAGFIVGLAWGIYGRERLRPYLLSTGSLIAWVLLNREPLDLGQDQLPGFAVMLVGLVLGFLLTPRRSH